MLDDALLVALGRIDLGVALTLGGEHDGALFALGAHLLLHRRQHVLRRRDVLDLVAHHLDAPRNRRLVQLSHDVGVDDAARLEGAVELDLADLAAQRGLRELRNGEAVIGDAVGGEMRIEHLHVEHRIDADLHVVARDADLLGDVEGRSPSGCAGRRPARRTESGYEIPACSVRLYLPRYSITNALCCGTTVAVLATMMTTMTAIAMAP